ncbi:hypothetical protein [Sanguibacter sp. 25GB23B1]|uniref:hypothetical protein n=1 Tax=unclassified Sanguibacter TaxID=2645534 RepID=UPI0032AED8F8
MTQNEPVSGLLLDESNPRFAANALGQDDAVTALLVDAPSKMVNLAKDIVEQGMLNPTEIPVAVEEDGHLVVIEGNRRLACLKLLMNPDLAAPATKQLALDLVKRFRDIAKSGLAPTEVEVHVAANREAAKHWLDLRHTGENDGVGVLEWASWQANNFRRKRGSQADRAAVFCDAVEATFPDDEQLAADIVKVRRNRLTTLGRLVADPEVRANFGFTFEDDELVLFYEPKDLIEGFRRIFSDLAGDLTVTEIKTKEQRAEFIRKRNDTLPDRSKKLSSPNQSNRAASDRTGSSGGGPGSGKQEPPQSDADSNETVAPNPNLGAGTNPAKPEPVIFHKLKLNHVNARISKLLKGAQKIQIDDSPQVVAVLIRILLELVVSDGIEIGVVNSTEGAKLSKKLRAALLAIDPQCYDPINRDKQLEMAWTRTQENDGMAIQTLHAFVHNLYGDPTASEVRSLSATFRPVLQGVDALIGGAK